MSNILFFVYKLKDMVSAPAAKAFSTVSKGARKAEQASENLNRVVKKTGSSINDLTATLDRLKGNRDALKIVTPADVSLLRVMNSEVAKLEASIKRRQTLNGSRAASWAKDAIQQIPGAALITNPLVMAGAAASYAVKQAGEREMQLVKFGTLLGNENKGAKVFSNLKNFANVTPYTSTAVLGAGETLLNYNVSSDKLMTYVKQLGDISGGSAERLNSLSFLNSGASVQ